MKTSTGARPRGPRAPSGSFSVLRSENTETETETEGKCVGVGFVICYMIYADALSGAIN
jgi:hypothetical protein